jgi:uncharacterized protein YbaR (Trm112 family)
MLIYQFGPPGRVKYRLLDLLACPIDKSFPLKHYFFKVEKRYQEKSFQAPLCSLYCSLNAKEVKGLDPGQLAKDCGRCVSFEVVEALLVCPSCNRWFPVIDDIPQMLPDELRDRESDLAFLRAHRGELPPEVAEAGRPYRLEGG